MMTHRTTFTAANSFIVFVATVGLAACQASRDVPATAKVSPEAPAAATPAPVSSASVTLVDDRSNVCMVNNQFMGRPQIPVQVDGKTYYGCCSMCKARLESDASIRTAVDPVSKAPVDKASAVIGKTATGAALYFASLDNLHAYASRDKPR